VVDAPKSNDTIQRARALGFSLQALTDCVRERLEAQPADHILIVEEDLGLREIIGAEVRSALGWPAELCSPEEAKRRSGVAVGAQVFAPAYILGELQPFIPENRPAVAISYSQASEHVAAIGALGKPSAIAVVSVSKSLLRTARGLLAPAIGRKHTYSEILISGNAGVTRASTTWYFAIRSRLFQPELKGRYGCQTYIQWCGGEQQEIAIATTQIRYLLTRCCLNISALRHPPLWRGLLDWNSRGSSERLQESHQLPTLRFGQLGPDRHSAAYDTVS
jgi:hypothetical protein